jgi:hypothetical protein
VIASAARRHLGFALALVLAASGGTAGSATLQVLNGTGRVVAEETLGEAGRWCLVWNHSVTDIEVTDCFQTKAGMMVLESSHQPDFAAGLGHIPGRGSLRSDGHGGYWIEGIDAAMPASGLVIRRGGPEVAHRLRIGAKERALPGSQGERLIIRLGEE